MVGSQEWEGFGQRLGNICKSLAYHSERLSRSPYEGHLEILPRRSHGGIVAPLRGHDRSRNRRRSGLLAVRLDAQPMIAAKPPRIEGDGTSRLLDGLAWMIGIAGYYWLLHLWGQWGRWRLRWSSGYSSYLLILVVLILVIALHECGHIAVGMVLGMKPRAFIIGPFNGAFAMADGCSNFFPQSCLALEELRPWFPQTIDIAAGAKSGWSSRPTDKFGHGSDRSLFCVHCQRPAVRAVLGFPCKFFFIEFDRFRHQPDSHAARSSILRWGENYQILKGGPLADYFGRLPWLDHRQ